MSKDIVRSCAPSPQSPGIQAAIFLTEMSMQRSDLSISQERFIALESEVSDLKNVVVELLDQLEELRSAGSKPEISEASTDITMAEDHPSDAIIVRDFIVD